MKHPKVGDGYVAPSRTSGLLIHHTSHPEARRLAGMTAERLQVGLSPFAAPPLPDLTCVQVRRKERALATVAWPATATKTPEWLLQTAQQLARSVLVTDDWGSQATDLELARQHGLESHPTAPSKRRGRPKKALVIR